MALKLHIVFHGSGSAFYRKPGCPCVRCTEPTMPEEPTPEDYDDLLAWSRQAHTSLSLVIEEDGIAVDHTLIDVGQGVVGNLTALPSPARNQPISRLLLTHGHFDHVCGIDGLLMCLRLGREVGDFATEEQPLPLPVFATDQTWRRKVGPNPQKPDDAGHFRYLADIMDHHDITLAARERMTLTLHPALQVTPIPVEHFMDSVHYLFHFWPSGTIDEGDPVRVAVCWDFMAYPNGHKKDHWKDIKLDPRDGWLAEQMHEIDFLAIEMTTWNPHPIGHISFEGSLYKYSKAPVGYGVANLIRAWRPAVTRIVHYDGYDDRERADGTWDACDDNVDPTIGPVLDRDLRRALRERLDDVTDVDIGHPGHTYTFE